MRRCTEAGGRAALIGALLVHAGCHIVFGDHPLGGDDAAGLDAVALDVSVDAGDVEAGARDRIALDTERDDAVSTDSGALDGGADTDTQSDAAPAEAGADDVAGADRSSADSAGSDLPLSADAAPPADASVDAARVDAAGVDAPAPDVAGVDAGGLDSARRDAQLPRDAGAPGGDGAAPDIALRDTAAPDAIGQDLPSPDSAAPDAVQADAGPLDQGSAGLDAAPPDTSGLNLVFVTAAAYAIGTDIQSVEDADDLCRTAASAADLPGTYVAWLSDGTRDAVGQVSGARGWVRVDGAPFAATVDDLVAGTILTPPRLDQHGSDLGDQAFVLTNTVQSGVPADTDPCDGWQHLTTSTVFFGYADATARSWTSAGQITCASPAHLYCFSIDLSADVTVTPGSGRVAFVSTGLFAPGLGYGEADRICREEASAAGLANPSSFLALLGGVDGKSAKGRFAETEQAWVRPDGILLSPDFQGIFDELVRAPLNVTADIDGSGVTYVGSDQVWTGSLSLIAAPGGSNSCQGWTTGGSSENGLWGWANRSSSRRYYSQYSSDKSCSLAKRVYCLEGPGA